MTRRMTLLVLALAGPDGARGHRLAARAGRPQAALQRADDDAGVVAGPAVGPGRVRRPGRRSRPPRGAKPKTIEAELRDRVQIIVKGSEPGERRARRAPYRGARRRASPRALSCWRTRRAPTRWSPGGQPADRHPGDPLRRRALARGDLLVGPDDFPVAPSSGFRKYGGRAVAQAVVVPVVLQVAGRDGRRCRCRPAPRNFCTIAPLTVSVPELAAVVVVDHEGVLQRHDRRVDAARWSSRLGGRAERCRRRCRRAAVDPVARRGRSCWRSGRAWRWSRRPA